jgi:ketosteroid isomerase-like protein
MSQADIETIRAGYEAVNRGDWDSAFRAAHQDFEWKTADRVPLAGTYRGPEEVRWFFDDQRNAFEEMHNVWTMRDGKAARCEVFPVREEALEAVGLSE